MIYTMTLNPALDYVIKLNEVSLGELNRTNEYDLFIGGKGINVSRVLNNLKMPNVALGFIAGSTGDIIKLSLEKEGIRTDFIKLSKGLTRINVKIKSAEETEINANGLNISKSEYTELLDKLNNIEDGDYLVLAGSIPSGLEKTVYQDFLKQLEGKKINFIIDSEKESVLSCLNYKPFLIKPNKYELENMFNVKINSIDELKYYARKLKELGSKNVLVSLGKDGAFFIDEFNNETLVEAKKGKLINLVGAGDSMIAGFLYGYITTKNYKEALNYAISAGSATAFSTDLATKEAIEQLL